MATLESGVGRLTLFLYTSLWATRTSAVFLVLRNLASVISPLRAVLATTRLHRICDAQPGSLLAAAMPREISIEMPFAMGAEDFWALRMDRNFDAFCGACGTVCAYDIKEVRAAAESASLSLSNLPFCSTQFSKFEAELWTRAGAESSADHVRRRAPGSGSGSGSAFCGPCAKDSRKDRLKLAELIRTADFETAYFDGRV